MLASLKSMPWEYSDILADYALGLTTCALFLRLVHYPINSLKRPTYLEGKHADRCLRSV